MSMEEKTKEDAPMTIRGLIQSDLARFRQTFSLRKEPYRKRRIFWESLIFKSGFRAVLLYRFSHWFHRQGWNYIAWWLTRRNLRSTGAEIEYNAEVGPGLLIAHPVGIVIGRGTRIGAGATLFQGVSFGVRSWHPDEIRKFPVIGDGCFFFANASVIGDISIGNGCIVGANTVVAEDMPEGALAIGSPAKILPEKGKEMIQSWTGREMS